jgi:hypothetical protein
MPYPWDAFISYSHLDDRSPSGPSGWVTRFREQFDDLLTKRVGREARIWRDTGQVNGQRLIDATIETALPQCAILVVLYSASYEGSVYCGKEREWFATSGTTIGDQSRVFIVRLVNIPRDRWPKEFRGCRGFDFFRLKDGDPIGYPLDPDDKRFRDELEKVVAAAQSVLTALGEKARKPERPQGNPPLPPPAPPPPGGGTEETREFELLKQAFKEDFQRCGAQIKLLSARKDFHDQLHELQLKFFVPVSAVLQGNLLTVDAQLTSIVREHNFTLSEIFDSLQAIANRKHVPDSELGWLNDLSKAKSTLEAGVLRSDIAALRAAVSAVGRVLAVWPPRINTKLNENARDLALADLATKLEGLCTKSSSFGQSLGAKVQKLRTLHVQISELAAVHDHWQTFDDEMRLFETTLNQSLSDIADIWPALKEKARTLKADNPAAWTTRLNYWDGEMERALQDKDIAGAQKCFIRLRSAARERFYVADKNLKDGCQALQQAGEPIEAALSVV